MSRSWAGPVGLWAALTVLAGAWGLALPLMASPDEQSHVVKAAAVVRGELTGVEDPDRDPRIAPGRPTLVQLPETYASVDLLAQCHAFRPEITADCAPALSGDADLTTAVPTFAGRYPPLYYALVGWPSLLSSGVPGLYGMRALSGALAAVPLTAGLLLLRRTAAPRLAVLGAGVALTPMAVSLLGVVNPSALEIACAFCAWSALLSAVLHPDPALLTRRVVTGALALAVMVNLRASAPLFGLLLVAAVVAVAPWPVLRSVLRARTTRVAAVAGVLAGVASAAWVLGVGTLQGPVGRYPELADPAVAARQATGRSVEYLRQMVGVFGWLDAPAPALVHLAWGAATAALLVLAACVPASRRARLTVLGTAVALVALPVGLQLPAAGDAGLIWQGRYLLPLAVGLPLLCALLLGREPGVPALLRRLDPVLVPALVAGHAAALYWVLRRYAVGTDGELLVRAAAWQPPLGVWPVTVGYAVALVATVLLLRALFPRAAAPLPAAAGPLDPGPPHVPVPTSTGGAPA